VGVGQLRWASARGIFGIACQALPNTFRSGRTVWTPAFPFAVPHYHGHVCGGARGGKGLTVLLCFLSYARLALQPIFSARPWRTDNFSAVQALLLLPPDTHAAQCCGQSTRRYVKVDTDGVDHDSECAEEDDATQSEEPELLTWKAILCHKSTLTACLAYVHTSCIYIVYGAALATKACSCSVYSS